MAKGSEKFSWSLFPGAPRVCAVCEKPLRIVDVWRHETRYVDGKAQPVKFFCVEHVHARAA